jgi:hypothetical protein
MTAPKKRENDPRNFKHANRAAFIRAARACDWSQADAGRLFSGIEFGLEFKDQVQNASSGLLYFQLATRLKDLDARLKQCQEILAKTDLTAEERVAVMKEDQKYFDRHAATTKQLIELLPRPPTSPEDMGLAPRSFKPGERIGPGIAVQVNMGSTAKTAEIPNVNDLSQLRTGSVEPVNPGPGSISNDSHGDRAADGDVG